MNNKKYCDAMAEVLYYFNGIDETEIARIPTKLIDYFKANATKDYICNFDYNKPLKELELKNETKALIGMIYINYICEDENEKQRTLSKLSENDRKHQEKLKAMYNTDNLFKKDEKKTYYKGEQVALVKYKENKWYKKIIMKIKKLFTRK